MPIAFDRFVALTAALAGAGASVTGCGSDPVTHRGGDAGSGGSKVSAGKGGKGGTAGAAGRSTGGTSSGGKVGRGGSAGRGTGGRAGAPIGGSENSATGGAGGSTGGTSNGGSSGSSGGSSGTDAQGGEAGDGMAGEAGAFAEGGAAGAPDDVCLGDVGISDCSTLGLPTDECRSGRNPVKLSCEAGTRFLRPGVLEGLGACLLGIGGDACSVEAEQATAVCETSAAAAACPKPEAAQACQDGVILDGGGTIPSPLAVCTDGTLSLEGCTELLNVVTGASLPEVVLCADPAGEYSWLSAGTCAERLHLCTFGW
jgi:hypothetical protein